MKHSPGSEKMTGWQDVVAPVILLLTGLFLTSGACLEWLSLDKMQNLWPAALILFCLVDMVTTDVRERP